LIQNLANTVILKSYAEISAKIIERIGEFLESHLKEAAVSGELGRCMDDVILDVIPPTWPLIAQMFMIVTLFEGLYVLAENPVSALVRFLTLC